MAEREIIYEVNRCAVCPSLNSAAAKLGTIQKYVLKHNIKRFAFILTFLSLNNSLNSIEAALLASLEIVGLASGPGAKGMVSIAL